MKATQQGFAFPSELSEEFTAWSYFLLYHGRVVGEKLKILHLDPSPLPRQCVGVEGQVWFLLRPRHGPLSQYRAQTTAALSPRQLNSCFLPQAARRPPHSFPPAAG